MSTDPQVLLMLASGIGSVGVVSFANRVGIARLKDAIWGPDRATDGGLEGGQESLFAKIDDLDTQLKRNERERAAEHREVREDLGELSKTMVESFAALCDELDDVDADDVVPEDD